VKKNGYVLSGDAYDVNKQTIYIYSRNQNSPRSPHGVVAINTVPVVNALNEKFCRLLLVYVIDVKTFYVFYFGHVFLRF